MIISIDYFRMRKMKTVLDCLLTQRIEIIESTAYGNLKYEQAVHLLNEISENPLLKTDLGFLKELELCPTEIDMIKDIEIIDIERLRIIDDIISISADIVWTVEGSEGPYIQNTDYYFEIKKNGNQYKLVDYYPIETGT